MAVRTKLLASGRLASTSTVVIYTTPADETTIVKRLNIGNASTTDTRIITVGADATGFNQTFFAEFTVGTRGFIDHDLWLVLPPGFEFTLRSDGTTNINYWLSGTQLEGVAD